jgi:GNAT superfamily N-acetyltransferase
METELVDPADEIAFRTWFGVTDSCHVFDWPGQPGWQLDELRARALDPGGAFRLEHLMTTDDAGTVVGAARLELPLRDNVDTAQLIVNVHPEHRGRGVGSVLLDATERQAQAHGRSVALVRLEEPAKLAGRSPGRAFALRHGYACAQTKVRRDFTLPPDEQRFAALEAACTPQAAGYRIVGWRDRCPDEFLDDRAELARRMSTDAPQGGLNQQEQRWDAARVREQEALAANQGRTFLVAGAVHEATGRLVAFTDIGVPAGAQGKVFQRFTLVLREHRGHRLGTLIKIANHRALAAAFPELTSLDTLNADDNTPMIAVNEALGYVPVGTVGSWRREL